MALDFSKFGTPVEQTSALDFSKFGTPVGAPEEKQSFFRQVADVPLGVARGAVQGVRMIADAFGAGSETSNTIKGAEEYIAGLMSAEAKKDQAEIARIMKDAEDKGVLDQVKAGLQAFTIAPVDTLSQALGTAAPVIVGALGAKILGAGALVGTGVGAVTGATMGAGAIKGSIYEETKKALIEAGEDPVIAEEKAQLAQSTGGKNLDQILLGTVIGGVAAVGPLEKGGAAMLARRILGKAAVDDATETTAEAAAKGALRRRAEAGVLEALPEAGQAAQQQIAENIALQREGFDVPTMRGVAGAATLEGLAGAGLGATVGGGRPEVAPPPVEEPPPAPPPAPAPALEFKPEPYIQFPDGSVAKQSEVEAYIKTLPEDQQMAMRAKLLGLAPQEAEKEPEPPAKALEFKPEPLVVYPDGSVARRSEVEAYVQSLPEEEQIPARARLLGMGEQATQVTPEMLKKLGIRSRAAIIQRLSGLELTDPKVTEELTNFAQQPYASPEVRGNIFGFLNTIQPIKTTVTPAAAPVEPPVEPPVPPAEPPSFEQKIVSRQPAPDGMEVHVFTTTDGYGTGLFDADAGQYVDGSITRFVGTDTLPKAEARAAEMLSKATPSEEEAKVPTAKREPSFRKEAQTFGTAIGAAQPYPGELRGRVNLPAQKAAKEGNFQGVLSALEKSKNVIVSEIAKRAKSLGTKIVIDDNAEETYTGQSTLMRQMSIDGAKMHLEALNKIRELAPQVDALPDKAELGYAIRGETINAIDGGESVGRMGLEDIAKMGHSMFAPLPIGEGKFRTKEDFKRLQKAYEDLTSEYGENALQLTSTGSAKMRGVAGAYDADTDTIRVPEYFAKREEVLSHEIVHAQTVQAIANPTLRQKPIVARLKKLYEHVKEELEGRPGRAPYGIQSIQEFVAEGMGNPAFQFLLKKIKYENTSAWDKFVQTIADLIGVKRDTAFTELLSIYSDLTTEQKTPAPKVKAPAEKEAGAPPALDTSGVKEVKGRHPQVQAAAKLLQENKLTREEFEKYVDYYKPIEEIEAEKLLPPTSEQRMNETVNADKRDRINVPVEDGTKVGLRMDLPARERGGAVVSIHEGKPGKQTVGKLIGFRSTGWLKDVTFEARSQEKGLAVATGAAKAPQQTVEGTWQNLSPEETYARVKELMKDPAWTQVGFDPSRHGYFYDRKSREPVVSASEMYQVGQFLLAKDVKYASKTEFLYSIDPTIKSDRIPSYKRGVENLRKQWDKGDITSDEFASRVDILAKQIEMAELAKEKAGRERGADFLRQRLLEAKRRGELSPEAVDFAEWFILKNPALVDDLGISIRTPKEDGVGGMYSSYGRVMYLMKERGTDQTVVHEILHHLERMMPKDVQSAIRKTWTKSLMQAQKDAKTDAEKKFFKNLTDFHFGSGSRSLLKAAIDAIKDGDISKDFYQYTSPSEFWAENGSEIMKGRFDVKGSLLGKLKQWLSELKEKARDLFGLDNKAAIIRALDSLSKGDGKFVTSTLLDETTEPKLSVTGKPSLKEKIIEAGREAGQKRKLDKGAFEGVSKDLVDSLEPTFAPRNVTVQDRILGMRDNFWQRMAQGIADQYRTIKEYSEEAYMKARLSKTVDGGLEGLMFYGQVFNDGGALNIKQNTRGMFDVLKPVGKELDRYLIWVALNREASLPDAKRSINPDLVARRNELSYGNISGKSRKEVYEQVQRDMNALNRSVLKVALDAGLLNTTEGAIKDIEANEKLSPEEKREKIAELRKNPIGYERFINDLNYIPFYRVMEEGDTDSVSKAVSATGLTSQYFSKALKGGEKPFGDLMENTLRNWNHILSAAMKNQAAVATVDAAVKAGAAKPNLKPGLEMRDGKVYSIMSDEIVGDGSVRPELTEAGKGTVKIVVDGKNAYYEVTDPLLLDSITSIGYLGPQSKFLDVARDFKNILQFGVTISPQFKVNNLLRDSVAAMGVSELRKNPIANVLEGVSLSDRNSPTYIAAMAGGAVFNFGTAYEGDQSRLIKRLLKMGVDRDHILDSKERITAGLRYAWDKYQEWGNKSEAANRLALYKQLRDGGMSHLEASFKARDLLDFSMQGSWPAFRVLTQVIPFLNARVQGLYKLGRDGIIPTARVINNTLTGKPTDATDRQKAQQFMIVSSAVMLASALLYLTFKDDEEYKRRDEWDKDNFWWFRLPGMDFALRVPKPFEIGALGTLVERTLEQIVDSGAEGKQFGDAVKRTLGSTFALNPIPQMFKPLVDIYANKDAFTGAPIESAGLERLSKQERMINTTSPLAIALGKVSTLFPEAMELSPVQADYLIKGYFGWLGATAATTSMYATMPFNEGEYPDARWMDRLSLGLARELPGRGAKYVTAFYESNKEISQAFADMRHYAEMGDSEKVQQILEEKGDKIQLAKFYDKTAKTMANIRKQIRVIQNDPKMDGAAKKEEIDRMNDLISELAKQAEEVRKSMKP